MDVEALTLLRSATASLSSSTLDRLSLSSSSATAHITSDTSLVLDAIQHSVATITVTLSRKARLAHKQFIALSEEFDAHIKSLLCCYHQLTSNLIDEANDDTLWDSHQLLGAMLDTPLPSAYLSGGTLDPSALAIVDNISTFQSEVHVGRSAVFMPPSGLFRGSVNTVRIQCLDDSGEPVLCLSTNDIRAKLSPIEAVAGWEVGAPALEGSTVCISVIVSDDNACRDGRLLVTIAECSTIEIFLQVVASPLGTLLAVYDTRMGPDSYGNIGIAVNSSGTVAAISNFMTSMVLLLSLPTGEPFHAFGGSGTEPGQFRTISRLCFLQSDKSLIIADARNRRLQEVSLAGEHMRTIGSGVFTSDVISVATCPSYIAAGTIGEGNQVYLFSADTSDFIRSFGWKGSGEGQLRQSVGLRFTPDGSHIVVADDESNRLVRFTLSGEFVEYIGAGLLLEPQDVVFASNGDAIVADSSNNRICVFTPNGSALLRSFGSEGDAPGQFKCPVGLAIHGNTLYVIDTLTARLQIFQ